MDSPRLEASNMKQEIIDFEKLTFPELTNWLDWAFENGQFALAKLMRDEISTRISKAEFGEMS